MSWKIEIQTFTNRIIALLLFVIMTFAAFLVAFRNAFKDKDFYFNVFLITCFAGLYGYTFQPLDDFDLHRIHDWIRELSVLNFQQAAPMMVSSGDFSYFFYWLFGRIGINAQWIGFISAAILYGSTFIIMKKLTLIFRQDNFLYISFGVLLIICSIHPWLFSGVRNAIAIAVFCLGYLYFIEGKRKLSIFLCLFSISLHYSLIIFVILFFLNGYMPPKNMWLIFVIICLVWVFYNPLLHLLLNILNRSNALGIALATKMDVYTLNWDSRGKDLYGLSTASRIWLISEVFLLVATLFFVIKKKANEIAKSDKTFAYIRNFTILFLMSLLLFTNNFVALGRYLSLGAFVCSIYLIAYGLVIESENYTNILLICVSLVVGIAAIALLKEYNTLNNICTVIYQNVPSLLYRSLFYLLGINVK